MKKTFVSLLAVCAAVIGLHSFRVIQDQSSGIKGTITPADAVVTYVWAISGKDSVKVTPDKGMFTLATKAGTWKVIVDAAEPNKDAVLENVIVKEGAITDVGEIQLPQ